MPSARSLQRWLALRIVLAGLVPLAVVTALVWGVLLPQLRADLEIRYQTLARAIAGQIETHLLGAARELYAVTEYLRSRGQRPAPFWFSPLDAHAGAGDVFAAIYIVEADSSVYAVGLPPATRGQRDNLLGLDLSQWVVLREARERNEAVWSETFLSAVTGRLTVTLAIPVVNQILVGEIAIDRLSDFIGRLPVEAGMVTMILDRRGQIIAHSQAALSGQQLGLGHLPIVGDALQGRFATRSFEWDGETLIGAPVSVPQLGWIVLVAQPRSEAFRPFLATLWMLAAGALVALLLAILVALVLAHGFAQRIGHYAEQAHAIAEGDYDQPWPVSDIREFASLGGDLDRMSFAIRQRERDLATSEARYRSVINNAPIVIFQFDEQGVFSLSEGQGLARVGLAPGEAVGQSVFELYRDYPEICESARRAISGEAFRCTSRTGEVFFDVSYNSVRDRDGHIQVMGVSMDTTERQRAEESLRQANLVVENSPVMLFRWKAEDGWPVAFVSHNVKQLGYSPDELLDGSFRFASLVCPEDLERIGHELRGYAEKGVDQFQQEYRIVAKDGTVRWIDDRTVVERNSRGKITHYQGIVIDITERKRAEEALCRSNRQLRMLSDCNQALIRITDEMELLTTICTISVREGGYRMAWVGYAEHNASKTVRPMAHAGFEEGYLQSVNITWADDEHGRGPIGVAIRTGRPCLVQNIASDSRLASRRVEAAKRGYAAVCALPLTAGGQTLGALGIYSSAPDAFDADEVALLSELASDLAFGITVLRTRIERERADQALRESEFFLRKSQEVGDLGSYYLDVRAGAWISSERLDQILGIDGAFPKTVNGWIEVIHPDDREEMLQYLTDHVLVKHNKFDKEYRIVRHNDGQERWVYGLGELAFDQSGVPIKMIGTIQDVTERKQAKQKLLESEHRYRELVENANSIILRWNSEGEITFINEFGLKFFGYSEAELVGQHVVGTIVPPNESTGKDLRPLMEEICLHPERFKLNVNENLRRGGERVWVSWTNKAVLDDRGQVVEVFSVGSDITERKRAEAELQRHREHLEELVAERTAELRQAMTQLVQSEKLAALGSLVAGVAHELNTPLGNARVVASSLGEHLQDFAAAVESGSLRRSQVDAFLSRGREAVDLLERNAARAADLINHFKQVAVDQTSTRRRSFNLRQTVEEVLVTLRPQFKHTAHRIALEIPPELALDSYPGPLEQVIANLISNSLTHGFEGIAAGVIHIRAAPLGTTHVHIDYTDNGVGIPETIVNRIFDPFFTTKLGSGGSGLGLYIVYNLVTGVLGGTIQVDSPPGVAFTLTLPRTAPNRSVLDYSQ